MICKNFKNCVTSNGSIDIFELACGIKVPVNKNELVETLNKTWQKRYIPNCNVFLLVTFRFSTFSNQRNRTKSLVIIVNRDTSNHSKKALQRPSKTIRTFLFCSPLEQDDVVGNGLDLMHRLPPKWVQLFQNPIDFQ